MAFNNYSTAYLLGMVSALDRPRRFLFELFFGSEMTFDTEEIVFDKVDAARRLAPFVSPYVAGKAMRARGAQLTTFKPPYVKPKHVVTPGETLKRKPGEALLGQLTLEQRFNMLVQQNLRDQDDQISRLEEWMASSILRTGKVICVGEDFPAQEVDLGRPVGHTVQLLDAARWGEAGVKVLGNLRTWATTVSLASGFNPRQVIMDPLAAELLLADAEMKELLDNRRQRSGSVELAGAVTGAQGEEVVHLGSIGQFEFWQYQQIYSDDAGAVQKYMPDYTVLLGSPAGAEGVRCYGAILDTKVLRAMSRFPKMWDQDDPSVTTLMTQSAPLPVLKRPAATMCVTVR